MILLLVALKDKSALAFTKLDLSTLQPEEKLKKIPQALLGYVHLKIIDISQNSLTDFEQLSSLPVLQVLLLNGNSITSLPLPNAEETVFFSSLRQLNLSRNKLAELPALKFAELQQLDVSENEIKKLDGIEGLPQLTHLNLSHNQISDCSKIRDSNTLQTLIVSHNRVRTLPHFPSLISLNKCNLRGNYVF